MGMAIGVALVEASPAHPRTHPFTEPVHLGADAHLFLNTAGDNDNGNAYRRYRQGMVTVLCIYASFLFLPVLLYQRRNSSK